MLRTKGGFRKGRKVGARSNLHNFRSNTKGIPFMSKAIAVDVAEKAAEKVEVAEIVEATKKKKKAGRPKKEK
jgi:hypothetical protein